MSNRNQWQISMSTRGKVPDEAFLCAMEQAGIRNMEFSISTVSGYQDIDFVHTAANHVAAAAAHGVTVPVLHLPFTPFASIDPSSPDPEVRRQFRQIQGELLRAAGAAGIRGAVVHPSGEPYPVTERADRLARTTDTLAALAGTAKSAGVLLLIENLPRTCISSYSAELVSILRAIPEAAACFDTNHSLYEDNRDYLRAIAPRVRHLHMSDYDGVDERHTLPGTGINPWGDLFAILEDAGYDGLFNYESGTLPDKVAENRRMLLEQYPARA